MSAFLCVPYADRVEILTDAAHIGPDDTIVKLERKIWKSETCPLVVTGRGDSAALENVAQSILKMAACGDVDLVVSELSKPPPAAPAALPFFEVLIAAYITSGPWAGICLTHPPAGLAPLAMHRIDDIAYGGPPFDMRFYVFNRGLGRIGPSLFGGIRKTAADDPSGLRSAPVYGVGGWLDHTVISANGVTTSRLCRWPDVVGEKIRVEVA